MKKFITIIATAAAMLRPCAGAADLNPKFVGQWPDQSPTRPSKVATAGSHAFVAASYSSNLQVIDISDAANMRVVAGLEVSGGIT